MPDLELLALADELDNLIGMFGPRPPLTAQDVAETAALLGWLPEEPYLKPAAPA